MAAQWIVRTTSRTGLTRGLAEVYADQVKARGSSDAVALLVPTQAAAEIARRIVLEREVAALLDARIMTFPQLAELILVANRRETRQITPLQRELLLGDVLAGLSRDGKLGYLQATWNKPGTVAAVGAVLDEIKRGGVSSDDFPTLVGEQAREHPANNPLSAIFSHYQQRLHDLGLYDEPGLFWSALETLQGGERKPLEGLQVLLLDGFQEFTTTQLQMLQTLGEHLERLEVRLWIDPRRKHLTPRSRETLRQLQQLFNPEVISEDDTPAEALTALAQLRRKLFSADEADLTAPEDSVQIVEAPGGMIGECREIARRVKRLLKEREDLSPQQIAIFLRSWDSGYDTALRQALEWYGVPVDFARGPALASVPVVQTVLGVLDVVTGGWLRQDVIKLLNSNYVGQLLEGESWLSARRLEQLALEAGIIGGVLQADSTDATLPTEQDPGIWWQGFEQLKQRLQNERLKRTELEAQHGLLPGSEDSRRLLEDEEGNRYRSLVQLDRMVEFVEQAQSLVRRLNELLAPLETASSLAAAAQACEAALVELEVVKRAGWGTAEEIALDLQGLEALSQLLRAMAESPEVLQLDAEAGPQQFADQLRLACSTTRLPGTRHRRCGVQVLELAQAGLDSYAVAIVCGMRDGVFPARRRPDVFYSEATRARLQATLPGLRPRLGDRHDDEHLLYGALAAATEQVWLTYPYTEASGEPVLRSLYVDEMVRHWRAGGDDKPPPGLIQRRGQADVIAPLAETFHYLEALEALQALPVPVTARDLEQLNAAGNDRWPALALVKALGEMETRRTSDAEADIFSGVLTGTQLIRQLSAHFGPDHTYSISQINTYAGCPMRFFFERVLRLEAPPEPSEGLDPRDLGSLIHLILKDFFGARRGTSLTPEAEELAAARAALQDCIDQNRPAGAVGGAPGVWDQAVARIRADLEALLDFEARQHNPDQPTVVKAVEMAFGNDRSFCLRPENGDNCIYLRGRIDRVDLMTAGGESLWVIWDYKTYNGVVRKLVLNATDVQLAVYALAVDHVFPGEANGSAKLGYYRVARPVGQPSIVGLRQRNPDDLVALQNKAREKIFERVAEIRKGRFPANPNEDVKPCKYCNFGNVCRVPRQMK